MRKLILFLLMSLVMISFVNAQCINIKQTCANCTWINVTSIVSSDSTQVQGQAAMTKLGNEYNYTFCGDIGTYTVNGIGNPDGIPTIWQYPYNIGNGSPWIWITLMILSISFFVASLIVSEELLVYISGIFFLITGIYVMLNGLDLMSIKDLYVKAIAYVFIGLGLLFTVGAYIFNGFSKSEETEEDF